MRDGVTERGTSEKERAMREIRESEGETCGRKKVESLRCVGPVAKIK